MSHPPPYRLLLLFSVHNADKSPTPAAFEDRLALMYLSALDLAEQLEPIVSTSPAQNEVEVDVGLTNEPFYSDKSAAIDEEGTYLSNPSDPKPCHVHLVGHDTFLRIFTPRYYSADPPLSALDTFFEQHALRITLRADSGSEEEQKETWEALRRGDMDKDGGKRKWAERIEVVPEEQEAVNVSSTDIRKACARGDWTRVKRDCTQRVTDWCRDRKLYVDEGGGSAAGKM